MHTKYAGTRLAVQHNKLCKILKNLQAHGASYLG